MEKELDMLNHWFKERPNTVDKLNGPQFASVFSVFTCTGCHFLVSISISKFINTRTAFKLQQCSFLNNFFFPLH